MHIVFTHSLDQYFILLILGTSPYDDRCASFLPRSKIDRAELRPVLLLAMFSLYGVLIISHRCMSVIFSVLAARV